VADPGPGTLPGAVSRIGQSLITALPPAFLMLVLLNVAFLGLVMWFLTDQLHGRDMMAQQLFNRCMAIALGDKMP
jgi:hypothetical protein